MKVVIAGGSGALGKRLANDLAERGDQVVILTRTPRPGPHRQVQWDGRTVGDWARELEAAAVVNLAGELVDRRPAAHRSRIGASVRRLGGMIACMDVLSSRILLRPADLDRSRRFYRDTLGLAVYREFGDRDDPGLVFFLGGGHLEISGIGDGTEARNVALWLQVRDLAAEYQRLQAAGVEILRAPQREPWGLLEMWIADPDAVRIVLVEVPAQHPLRRDNR